MSQMRDCGSRCRSVWGFGLTGRGYGLDVEGEEKRRVRAAPAGPGARCLPVLSMKSQCPST